MSLPTGNVLLAETYNSASQRARVITEAWVSQHGYCLACTSDSLRRTVANTQARDFECSVCSHAYELKSTFSNFGRRIADGAYESMMRRIRTSSVSSFLLMQYTSAWAVSNLSVIHHTLLTSDVIQQRKPLASTARRAGWVGCNILLASIPPEGRIPLIVDGQVIPRNETRALFAATENLSRLSHTDRRWAASVLRLLHGMGKVNFSIDDAYSLEPELSRLFPKNRHVKAKIRQQLQTFRDAGLLTFQSRGHYRLTNSSPKATHT